MKFIDVLNDCHWINKIDDSHYEMFLDHHALSTFRSCEQFFIHIQAEGWASKKESAIMPWFFAVGIALHDALESLYISKRDGKFDLNAYVSECTRIWFKHKMDKYQSLKEYNAIGGGMGFVALLTQYAIFYNNDTERLRIIGTEIQFGKGKEVFLGSFEIIRPDRELEKFFTNCVVEKIKVDCYLAGRIDFLMDNGRYVGPMDHKSMAYIDGDPISKYNPQDGMTGYVFATKQIVEKNFPEIAKERQLNVIWMNFLGVANNSDANKRFKRLPMYKTDWQLEEFRKRNLTTFERIFNLVYFEQEPQWNTGVCSNMFRRDCQFKYAHQQSDLNSMFKIMDMDFERKAIWNPDMSHQKEEKEGQ